LDALGYRRLRLRKPLRTGVIRDDDDCRVDVRVHGLGC
jgi:hypothetical protein